MTSIPQDDLAAYLAPFGLSNFRPGQREVIETVLAGQDCLCVMPTGGGKSLCYQLPAVARGGLTLVISPLIALMKDQVDTLQARGLSASFINSTLAPEEQSARLERMVAGEYRLMYVVPERFRSPRFVDAARAADLRLLAVDEAHCVSEWGHDFRPDYARLGRFREQLGHPPTIALTATATDSVRRDIVELLNLRDPQIFITGFARPNLHYAVQACPTDKDKDAALFRFLQRHPGSGIVYASTRKRCEELAQRIGQTTGRRLTVYHAGLSADERRAAQDQFMRGESEIAVATLAFGMGIDKADVRFVVHYNLPGSLEAYYQEAGRAGRDGQPAGCLLLFGGGDRFIHEFFIESSYPGRDVVRQVYEFFREQKRDTIEMTQQEVKEALALSIGAEGIGACEKLLETAGVLERLEASENTAAVRLASDLPTLVDLLPPQARVKRQVLRAVERLVGSLRHQWYYFQPRELLRDLADFTSTDLTRNLRELSTLNAFDYVPPFRGRAIHVRERTARFEDLPIDFETLEAHKAAEYARIDRVIGFAKSHDCRQRQILHYFGELEPPACGHCDNCEHPAAGNGTGNQRTVTPKVLEAVRIVLSGVARVTQRRSGCGKQLLAQMLCGSRAKAVERNRLDKLSTFGLLGHLKQPEVAQLIDALLGAGLLEQNEIEPFRPVVQMTARGGEVMSGRDADSIKLTMSDELWSKLDPTLPLPRPADQQAVDNHLLGALRRWREQSCKSQNVPAYVVLSNAALDELARVRPSTLDGLLAIKGIGPAKARQYGDELLQLLGGQAAHATAAPRSEERSVVATPVPSAPSVSTVAPSADLVVPPRQPEPDDANHLLDEVAQLDDVNGAQGDFTSATLPRASPAPRATHYWTWRLLSAGFSAEDCAAIRALSSDVVLDHALRAADEGCAIDAAWFLSAELIAHIEKVVGAEPPVRIRPLLAQLPRGTRYEEVQLVVKSRQNRGVSADG